MAHADLLLEWLVTTRTQWGTRISAAGQVEEYSDRTVSFDGRDFVTQSVPLQWRPLTHLSGAELDRLKAAIQTAHFFSLPARIEPDSRLKDGTTSTWTVTLDGQQHQVTTHESSAEQNAALQDLGKVVQAVTATALNRPDSSAIGEVC